VHPVTGPHHIKEVIAVDATRELLADQARELLGWDREYLWHPWSSAGARWPLMVAGEGCFVADASGRRYLDARACTLNAVLGYGHPAVIEAVTSQMSRLMTYDLSCGTTAPAVLLARRIAGLLPSPLTRTFFVNSGSEATEAAIRIARMYHRLTGSPGRRVVITLHDGYHGATLAALAATGSAFRRAGTEPLPDGFVTVRTPRCPACADGTAHQQCEIPGPDQVADVISSMGPGQVAAVLIEPVLGIGGVIPLPDGYLAQVRQSCDEHGVLLIADEVMTGLARTGRMFGFQHDGGVIPDIVTTGKHLAGGHLPLAAVTTTQAIYETFTGDPLLGGAASRAHHLGPCHSPRNSERRVKSLVPDNASSCRPVPASESMDAGQYQMMPGVRGDQAQGSWPARSGGSIASHVSVNLAHVKDMSYNCVHDDAACRGCPVAAVQADRSGRLHPRTVRDHPQRPPHRGAAVC
jgi:adenosylmethionine-8-amino-7-oxononanoate aminotransferase